MDTIVIGDARATTQSPYSAHTMLAEEGASLAEVVVRQLPRIDPSGVARIVVAPGSRDLLDGYDESYIHARIVEILDTLVRIVPNAAVEVSGFPRVSSPSIDTVRRACDAAAEVTARMRGMSWRPAVQNAHPSR